MLYIRTLVSTSSILSSIRFSSSKISISNSFSDNDNNFLGYEDLDETSSLNDIVTVAKGSFETFKVAFSILPKFIWAFLFITLGCIVALRILGR